MSTNSKRMPIHVSYLVIDHANTLMIDALGRHKYDLVPRPIMLWDDKTSKVHKYDKCDKLDLDRIKCHLGSLRDIICYKKTGINKFNVSNVLENIKEYAGDNCQLSLENISTIDTYHGKTYDILYISFCIICGQDEDNYDNF